MKQIEIKKEFSIQKDTELYAEYIQKTAALLQRPYIVVFKMVESWEPSVMANLYDESITKYKNRGYKNPAMMWWCERRKIIGID